MPNLDGNCLFATAAHLLNTNLNFKLSAGELRQKVVSFLSNFPCLPDGLPIQLSQFVENGNVSVYLKKTASDGEYGDHITLLALCCLFKVQFVVLSSLGVSGTRIVSPREGSKFVPDLPVLLLGHYAETLPVFGKHYVGLKSINSEALDEVIKLATDTTSQKSTISNEITDSNPGVNLLSPTGQILPVVLSDDHIADSETNKHVPSALPSSHCAHVATDIASTEFYDIAFYNRFELTDSIKKMLLSGCSKRPHNFQFPSSSTHGRRFNPSWENRFSWLRYSVSLDAAFCAPCFVFAVGNRNGELIDKPFKDWKNSVGNKRGRCNAHAQSDIHKQSLIAADNFLKVANDDMKPITSFISQAYAEKVARNRSVMKSLIDVVLVCARRGFPLRGHTWNKYEHAEDGNFAYLVHWAAKSDAVLQSHLDTAGCNSKYLSPTTQNEIIACIESEIRDQLVKRCNNSRFISVMADETTDCGGIQQLAICVRYVHEKSKGVFEVCEDFMGFVQLKVANAEDITDTILGKMSQWGVDLTKLRGKGFDGASTMSGHISGVQQRITEKLPMAKYFTHCSSHCLNLVVVHCCKLQTVRNFIDSLQRLSAFIRGSGKRKRLQEDIFAQSSDNRETSFPDHVDADVVNDALDIGYGRHVLPSLCETRWLARVDAMSTLLARYSDVYETLTAIYESGGPSASEAYSLQMSMSNFSWLLTAVVSQYILAFIRPLSLSLQAESCDLMLAYEEAQNLISVLQKQRSEEIFHRLFDKACSLGTRTFGDTFKSEKPRTCTSSRNRPNAGDTSQTDEEYFRRNLYYPFVDAAVTNMKERFPVGLKNAILGSFLIPHKLEELDDEALHAMKEEFSNDLPQTDSLPQEVCIY